MTPRRMPKKPGSQPHYRRQRGFGLAFLMAFSGIILTTMVSAALVGNQTNAVLMGDQVTQSAATSLAVAAMPLVKADIQSQLNSGTTITTSYTKTGTITIPQSPTNLSGATNNSGTYSASVLGVRGNLYLINVQGKATDHYGSTIISSQNSLLEIKSTAQTPAQVLSAIQAGNIASVSNASLISFAQNSSNACKATAPSWVTSAYPLTYGSGSNISGGVTTLSGSGTYNGGNIGSGATVTFNGTYSNILLNAISGSSGITSKNTSGSTRTVVFNSMAGGVFNLTGSSAQLIEGTSLNTGVSLDGHTGSGNQTVLMNTTFTGSSGIQLGTAIDSVYINAMSGGVLDVSKGSSATVFFDALNTGGTITGSPGNDTIICNGTFSGSCSGVTGSSGISAGNGNDVIGINGTVSGGVVDGQAGANIICTGAVNTGATINATSSGNSLMIVSGNVTGSSGLTASGSNNVLLLKTGVSTSGGTISGFGRTLSY